MSLGCYPEFTVAVRADTSKTGVWFNIALVRLFCLVAFLDDHIGFFESCFNVAVTELTHPRHV